MPQRRSREGSPSMLAAGLLVVVGLALFLLVTQGAPRPSGVPGHGLGIVGYLLMLFAAFGHSWRKNVGRRGPGSTRRWLDAHVVAGIAGPAMIVVHSGFAFRGLAGVTTMMMLVVVASGVVGRFVYTRAPTRASPERAEDVTRLDEEIAALEQQAAGSADESDETGGGTAIARRLAHDPAVEAQIRTLWRLRADQERLYRSVRSRGRLRKALAIWWALHVPLSAAMLVLGLVHALAALYYAAR